MIYFGVVEDIKDPLLSNRVRVRVSGIHTANLEDLPTEDLPWSIALSPTNSASVSGVGETPHGLVCGSVVAVSFIDKNFQDYIILGAVSGIHQDIGVETPYDETGFKDPNGDYPRFTKEPDVNRLARNMKIEETIVKKKEDNRTLNWLFANKEEGWEEPESPYAAEYPFNKVRETESGHVFEVDDTPDAERIHEYHKTGTYVEIDKNGRRVTRIVGDDYTIVDRNGYLGVSGNVQIHVMGNAGIRVNNNCEVQVDGDMNANVHNDLTANVAGKTDVTSKESIQVKTEENLRFEADGEISFRAKKDFKVLSESDISTKSKGSTFVEASQRTHIKSGSSMAIGSGSSMDINSSGTMNVDYSRGNFGNGAGRPSGAKDVQQLELELLPQRKSPEDPNIETQESSKRGEEPTIDDKYLDYGED